MALEKIRVYTVEVSGKFVIKANNDAEALAHCQDLVTKDVKSLNYAMSGADGYELAVVSTPSPAPATAATVAPEPIP